MVHALHSAFGHSFRARDIIRDLDLAFNFAAFYFPWRLIISCILINDHPSCPVIICRWRDGGTSGKTKDDDTEASDTKKDSAGDRQDSPGATSNGMSAMNEH
jgi:hypothetical protein